MNGEYNKRGGNKGKGRKLFDDPSGAERNGFEMKINVFLRRLNLPDSRE